MMFDDKYCMELVDIIALMSKDRSTKIGAVLKVGPSESHPYISCNDIPHGVKDLDERRERPAKYLFTEHAERNVIYLAAKCGVKTSGGTLYTTGIPCADCARAVIQAGIVNVVVWDTGSGLEGTDRWAETVKVGGLMLTEAGVKIRKVKR